MLLECAQLPNERNTLGGIISGVPTATPVVLANGREDLPLTADGGFTFTTPLAAGSAYAVTVKTQSQGTGCVGAQWHGRNRRRLCGHSCGAVRCPGILGSWLVGAGPVRPRPGRHWPEKRLEPIADQAGGTGAQGQSSVLAA